MSHNMLYFNKYFENIVNSVYSCVEYPIMVIGLSYLVVQSCLLHVC